jgi:hypothetical protein
VNGSVGLAVVSLLGTGSYLVILAFLHVRATNLSPIHNAVSDYGVGRYGRVFGFGLWLSAVGVGALAAGLAVTPGSPQLSARDLVLLGLIAVPRVGMSLWPTTLEGERLTRTGALHYLCAIVAFGLTYVAIKHLSGPLHDVTPWNSVGWEVRGLAQAVGPELALVVITMLPPLRRVFGVVERIFLVTTNIWFVVVAVILLKAS